MMASVRQLFIVLLVLCNGLLTGCAANSRGATFSDSADMAALEQDEERLWAMAAELEQAFENRDLIYRDPAADEYLQQLIRQIFPEFADTMRVRVLRDPGLGGLPMPNGSIYVTTGLLTRLDTEAELASVLAHEGVHFTERHFVQAARTIKKAMVFMQLAAFNGHGLSSLVVAVPGLSSYSGTLESKADIGGFSRLRSAGYDVDDGADLLERASREFKANNRLGGWFAPSAVSLSLRAKAWRDLVRDAGDVPQVRVGEEGQFLTILERARASGLASMVEQGHADALIHILATEDRLDLFPPVAQFYLAEGYRQRRNTADDVEAIYHYQAFLAKQPDFAPAFHKLGLLQMQAGDYAAARENFEHYLGLAADAPEASYVRGYLKQMSEQ